MEQREQKPTDGAANLFPENAGKSPNLFPGNIGKSQNLFPENVGKSPNLFPENVGKSPNLCGMTLMKYIIYRNVTFRYDIEQLT